MFTPLRDSYSAGCRAVPNGRRPAGSSARSPALPRRRAVGRAAAGRAAARAQFSTPIARLKAAGTISSVRMVDRISPPITVTPIGARHDPSPPSDSAVGTMPATIATVVITIGCARLCPASRIASSNVSTPSPISSEREVDQQDRVLGDDAEQHQQPDEHRHRHRAARSISSASSPPSGASSSEPMLTKRRQNRR